MAEKTGEELAPPPPPPPKPMQEMTASQMNLLRDYVKEAEIHASALPFMDIRLLNVRLSDRPGEVDLNMVIVGFILSVKMTSGNESDIFRAFLEDFNGWRERHFKQLNKGVRRALKVFLQYRGVYTGRDDKYLPRSLAALVHLEETPDWDEKRLLRITSLRPCSYASQLREELVQRTKDVQNTKPFKSQSKPQGRSQSQSPAEQKGDQTNDYDGNDNNDDSDSNDDNSDEKQPMTMISLHPSSYAYQKREEVMQKKDTQDPKPKNQLSSETCDHCKFLSDLTLEAQRVRQSIQNRQLSLTTVRLRKNLTLSGPSTLSHNDPPALNAPSTNPQPNNLNQETKEKSPKPKSLAKLVPVPGPKPPGLLPPSGPHNKPEPLTPSEIPASSENLTSPMVHTTVCIKIRQEG